MSRLRKKSVILMLSGAIKKYQSLFCTRIAFSVNTAGSDMIAAPDQESRGAVPILMTSTIIRPGSDGDPIQINGRLRTKSDSAGEAQVWILKSLSEP
ncbi:MAG: hypothetical protein PHS44_04100 [Candidatus Dojkabacteria bacterium]|nr:hypothetical protein [Candidatus Dojkabacteria bacterium]